MAENAKSDRLMGRAFPLLPYRKTPPAAAKTSQSIQGTFEPNSTLRTITGSIHSYPVYTSMFLDVNYTIRFKRTLSGTTFANCPKIVDLQACTAD